MSVEVEALCRQIDALNRSLQGIVSVLHAGGMIPPPPPPTPSPTEREQDLVDLREHINSQLQVKISNDVEGDTDLHRGTHVVSRAHVVWETILLEHTGGYTSLLLSDFLEVRGSRVYERQAFPWVATLVSHAADLDQARFDVQEDTGEDGD